MGKKVRYQFLTGSLMDPFFRFTNKLEVFLNPVNDPRGTKIAEHFYKYANKAKPRHKGQKFTSSLDYDLSSSSSYIIFNYMNGMRQGYHFKHINMYEFDIMHKFTKKTVQFDRVIQGHQDDFQDQERIG